MSETNRNLELRNIQVGDNLSGKTIYIDFDKIEDFSNIKDIQPVEITCNNGTKLYLGKTIESNGNFLKDKIIWATDGSASEDLNSSTTGEQNIILPEYLGIVSSINKIADDNSYDYILNINFNLEDSLEIYPSFYLFFSNHLNDSINFELKNGKATSIIEALVVDGLKLHPSDGGIYIDGERQIIRGITLTKNSNGENTTKSTRIINNHIYNQYITAGTFLSFKEGLNNIQYILTATSDKNINTKVMVHNMEFEMHYNKKLY